MSLLIATALFLLGAVIASFIGVAAARLSTGESIFAGRSRCDACNRPLSPLSLVPILSYAAGGGKAQCCGVRLSPLSPLSEAALGGLFLLSYWSAGFTAALVGMLVSLSLLLLLVLYDLAHQILPPRVLAAFVAASAATGYLASPASFPQTVLMGLVLGGALALIHVLSGGRAMGLADAPLALGLSLLTGPYAFSGFVFSFWIGAVIGIVILLRRPAGSRMGIEVPFAPFLAAGFILAYFTQWNPFAFGALLAAFR